MNKNERYMSHNYCQPEFGFLNLSLEHQKEPELMLLCSFLLLQPPSSTFYGLVSIGHGVCRANLLATSLRVIALGIT